MSNIIENRRVEPRELPPMAFISLEGEGSSPLDDGTIGSHDRIRTGNLRLERAAA